MNEIVKDVASLLRLIPLILIFWSGWKHDDKLAMVISVVWVLAIVAGLYHWGWTATIFGTPLVVLISWYILKNHKGK